MNGLNSVLQLDASFWLWATFHLSVFWLAIYPIAMLRKFVRSGGQLTIHSRLVPPEGNVRKQRGSNEAYVLFLSGIGRVSSHTYSQREKGILKRIADLCPRAVVLDDVFAYSINNLPLTEERRLSILWRWAMRQKLKKRKFNALLGYLINLRNIVQVATSSDTRYSQVYNRGFSDVLVYHLQQYGYDLNSPKPLFIVSYSGAGQIAAGAVRPLREKYGLPVYAMMLACFFTEGPGVVAANHIWEFFGSMDRAYKLFHAVTPSRWLRLSRNAWSEYFRQGGVTRIDMGAMKHTGRGGYLDQNSRLPNGMRYIDYTASQFSEVINGISSQHEQEQAA